VSQAPSIGPGRHEARERALGLLYEAELRDLSASDLLDTLPVAPNAYAVAALEGAEVERTTIDALIDTYAEGWTVARLPTVDRAILRLGVWELTTQASVPAAVIIDEAVELAKEYSTEKSSSFVNGVLDAIARSVRS